MKTFVKITWFVIAAIMLSFTACDEEEALDNLTATKDVENFVSAAVLEMENSARIGRFGCYELVFPVTFTFPDGTTAEANSYEEWGQLIRTWRQDNPEAEEFPELSFPLQVISESGEAISINSPEELRELRSECRRPQRPVNGEKPVLKRCYEMLYPVTVEFPDGTTAQAQDREELGSLIRSWKANNPDSEEYPTIAFPYDVELSDGTVATVESVDDLLEIRNDCISEITD